MRAIPSTRALLSALIAAPLLFLAACDVDEEPTDGLGEGGDAVTTPTTPPATPAGTETASPTATDPAVSDASAVSLELVADGLTSPVEMTTPGDGSGRLFVVEQTGTVRVADADGQLLEEPFLDVGDRLVELDEGYDERGLLGLAFHPDYAENGRFYVYYSAPLAEGAPDDWDHTSHVSEFTVSAEDENVADPNSERIILTVDQPQGNHDGGHIVFGLDGYLYVPLGDGGAGNDEGTGHTPDIGNGQDRSNLLGTILRLDIDNAEGDQLYGIPDDNPFVDAGDDVRSEIWVYGLRNPYDISVDPDGEYGILISDAGQELYEEVSLAIDGGENFGWRIKEGTHCFDPETPEMPPEECADEGADGEPLVGPVVEYHRSEMGTVVSGAEMYHGTAFPDLTGQMVFTDWQPGGSIFVATPNENAAATGVDEGLWDFTQVDLAEPFESSINGIAADADGELYILGNSESGLTEGAGALYRMVPQDGGQ